MTTHELQEWARREGLPNAWRYRIAGAAVSRSTVTAERLEVLLASGVTARLEAQPASGGDWIPLELAPAEQIEQEHRQHPFAFRFSQAAHGLWIGLKATWKVARACGVVRVTQGLLFVVIVFGIFFVVGMSYEAKMSKPTPAKTEAPKLDAWDQAKLRRSQPDPRYATTSVDQKKADYEAGWKDGWLVGKTDAWERRARNGQKAMRLGEIHGRGRAYPDSYADGYHLGYNDGYYAAKAAGAPGA